MIDEIFRRMGVRLDTMEFNDYVKEYAIDRVGPGDLITAWVGGDDGTEEGMADSEQDRKSDGAGH